MMIDTANWKSHSATLRRQVMERDIQNAMGPVVNIGDFDIFALEDMYREVVGKEPPPAWPREPEQRPLGA